MQALSFAEDKGLQKVLLNIVSLADGRVCVVEDRGTLRAMEPGKDRFVDLELPGWQELFSCNNMYQDSHGAIWLATRGGGAFKLEAGKVLQYSPANGLGSGAVYCFGEDNDGQVWVGTIDGGLSVIGKEGVRTFSKANGLHSTFVRCIGRDREGNLLIGTNDNGLDIFKGDRFVSFGTDDGLTDPQVWAVAEDDNGRAWFGTNGGIVILSGRDGRGGMRTITAQQGALTDNFIRCLREDDKGYMWIGTDHGGLLRYDPRTDRVTGDIELSGTWPKARSQPSRWGNPARSGGRQTVFVATSPAPERRPPSSPRRMGSQATMWWPSSATRRAASGWEHGSWHHTDRQWSG
ncbi:MAG: hypothetical protein H6592_07965 [Flavobacteriales bacterium]|nr:hypothetical protein [Flavobacteriales bacterium]